MPAILTHDLFAHELLRYPATSFIATEEERNAFLLGNQGPDPLFFAVVSPALIPYKDLGSQMHDQLPSFLMESLVHTIEEAPETAKPVIRAYVAGFICHYLLDRAAHPFVYAQQNALCDAGVEGLTRADGHEVHAVIECELDEMMLYSRTRLTVASYPPHENVLRGDNQTLASISFAIRSTLWNTYRAAAPKNFFARCVRNYRLVERATYSPTGAKARLYGSIERLRRNHSFAQAFCHRDIALMDSPFNNTEHHVWTDPFTNLEHATSFTDIYEATLQEANRVIPAILGEAIGDFTAELTFAQASKLTQSLNFSGKPVAE